MIEASMGAVPGLLLAFSVLALLVCVPVGVVARRRGGPVALPVLLAASVAGVLCVTLVPALTGDAGRNACDLGFGLAGLNQSAWLNLALFVPPSLFAVLHFRAPVLTAVCASLGSALIEIAQIRVTGRSCSLTDFLMNSTGAVVGSAAGVLWISVSARESGLRWGRDARVALLVGAIGGAVASALLVAWPPAVHDAVRSDREAAERVAETDGAAEWLGRAARDAFGPDAATRGVRTVEREGRWIVSAENEKGTIEGIWPERKITRVIATDNRAESGALSAVEAATVGQEFAGRWFPDEVRGSTLKTSALAGSSGDHSVYELTYRRYVDQVMMPMRLDIAVTSGGRILSAVCAPEPDPPFDAPVLTRGQAEERVRHSTGQRSTSAVLLAQKIAGVWRPVWMMGMPEGSRVPDAFVDARTGNLIEPGS
ncbi:VanZ family protein [Streptomyces sp. NPDC048606]|uniref:VanZ family protein n=1 Tax=Streptomyces sp. NPDC048606 TaxID=3154726 RepID=UPI003413588D